MPPLTATGVNDDVVQELHMPIGPQALDEPMPSRPATCRVPGTPDRTVVGQNTLTHSDSTLVQRVRGVQRTRLSTS